MTLTNDLTRLAPQVAQTAPARAAYKAMIQSADDAIARGWTLRKGSSGTSARNGKTHIYASKDGEETRIWSGARMSAGFFRPLTSVTLGQIKDSIVALS